MRLKRLDLYPPGGWQFTQPETGWKAPAGKSFEQVVDLLTAHRQANPGLSLPVDRKTVAYNLEMFTIHRIQFDPHYVNFSDGETPPPEQSVISYAPENHCSTCQKRG